MGLNKQPLVHITQGGNAFCERFNRTLFGLLKTLTKEEKEKWPAHLPALCFAYNATPHSVTGLQPYQLMFGRRAPAPCDHWLGLGSYDDKRSVSKTVWVDKQVELIVAANKRALKNIKAGAAKNKQLAGGKELDIPDHNLVLLRDHPAGRNKIQDKYKPDLYKVLNPIKDRKNAYWIQPVKGKNPKPQMAHRRELFDLGMAEGEEREQLRDFEESVFADEPVAQAIPNFQATHKPVPKEPKPKGHDYNLRSRPVPKPRSSKIEASTKF